MEVTANTVHLSTELPAMKEAINTWGYDCLLPGRKDLDLFHVHY